MGRCHRAVPCRVLAQCLPPSGGKGGESREAQRQDKKNKQHMVDHRTPGTRRAPKDAKKPAQQAAGIPKRKRKDRCTEIGGGGGGDESPGLVSCTVQRGMRAIER